MATREVRGSSELALGHEAELWPMANALREDMDGAESEHVVWRPSVLENVSVAFEAKHAELEAPTAKRCLAALFEQHRRVGRRP